MKASSYQQKALEREIENAKLLLHKLQEKKRKTDSDLQTLVLLYYFILIYWIGK